MLAHIRTAVAMRDARSALHLAVRGTVVLIALVIPHGAVLAATITVTTTADELNNDGGCSLRESVQAASTDSSVDACGADSGTDTINLPAGTYVLSVAGSGEDSNATFLEEVRSDILAERSNL
jgi:CSLREA domain-containing protein